MAEAIAREGILSDALGSYSTILGQRHGSTSPTPGRCSAMSWSSGSCWHRPQGRASSRQSVTVSPRSTTGVGVDMAKEPVPAPVVIAGPGHGHGAGHPAVTATLPAENASSGVSPWAVSLAALAGLLILTLVLLIMRREKSAERLTRSLPGQREAHRSTGREFARVSSGLPRWSRVSELPGDCDHVHQRAVAPYRDLQAAPIASSTIAPWSAVVDAMG